MGKRLSFLFATVAALAIYIPASASALPTLHYVEGGALVPVGSTFTKTGKNVALTSTLLGEIKCEELNLAGSLSENSSATGIDGKGTKEKPVQRNCNNPNGTITINSVTLTTLQSRTSGVAKANFEANITIGSLVCTFVGKEVEGTYVNNGSVLTFTKAGGITSSPSGCGTVKLDGSFSLDQGTKAVKAVF